MVIALLLEAAELLEIMQWRNGPELEERLAERRDEAAAELSDILYWTLLVARDLEIDLGASFEAKMAANAIKYPVEAAKGSSLKYTELGEAGDR